MNRGEVPLRSRQGEFRRLKAFMEEGKRTTREHNISPTRRRELGYAVAVIGTVLAVLIARALRRGIGDLPLYLAFYPPILAAALLGGTRPGMLATLLCALAVNLFFMEPVGKLGIASTAQAVGLGFFIAINFALCILGGRFWKQSEALRENEALRQSDERLRQFIDQAPVAIAMLDTRMAYLAASRRWLECFCLGERNVLGRSHYEIFPEIPERWRQIHRRCLAGAVESADEDLFQRADGRRQWVRWEIQPWYAAPGVIGGLLIFSEEITGRVEATEALRQSEERFRTMADAIPQLAWIARPDGYIFWFNRRWYEYTGTTPKQMEGSGWQSVPDPRVLPTVLEQWRRMLASGQPFDMEFPLRGADGQFRPFLTRVMPLKDDGGRASLWFGTNTDITELRLLQEHLEEVVEERTAKLQEALAELEHMSYSMMHDMRAPLRAMQSFAGLLQRDCPGCRQPPSSDYLRRIGESANRLDLLITDALNYNKVIRENLPISPVEVGQLLRGMIQSYPNLQPPAAEITLEFKELFVLGNESLLTQCFGNLLDNAAKFVAPGVHPHIRVWAEEMQSNPALVNAAPAGKSGAGGPTCSPGPAPVSDVAIYGLESGSVRIWFADNGVGIPQEAQEKIFLMFERMYSQSDYPGTGIGLAIVKKALQRMGGRVGVESEPGQGSKFWVELPSATRTQAQEPLQHAA